MRALLAKKYINDFDIKEISKDIFELFDKYNYKKELAQQYLYGSLSRKLQDTPESHKGGTSDPVYKAAIKREKLLDYVNEFDTKNQILEVEFDGWWISNIPLWNRRERNR